MKKLLLLLIGVIVLSSFVFAEEVLLDDFNTGSYFDSNIWVENANCGGGTCYLTSGYARLYNSNNPPGGIRAVKLKNNFSYYNAKSFIIKDIIFLNAGNLLYLDPNANPDRYPVFIRLYNTTGSLLSINHYNTSSYPGNDYQVGDEIKLECIDGNAKIYVNDVVNESGTGYDCNGSYIYIGVWADEAEIRFDNVYYELLTTNFTFNVSKDSVYESDYNLSYVDIDTVDRVYLDSNSTLYNITLPYNYYFFQWEGNNTHTAQHWRNEMFSSNFNHTFEIESKLDVSNNEEEVIDIFNDSSINSSLWSTDTSTSGADTTATVDENTERIRLNVVANPDPGEGISNAYLLLDKNEDYDFKQYDESNITIDLKCSVTTEGGYDSSSAAISRGYCYIYIEDSNSNNVLVYSSGLTNKYATDSQTEEGIFKLVFNNTDENVDLYINGTYDSTVSLASLDNYYLKFRSYAYRGTLGNPRGYATLQVYNITNFNYIPNYYYSENVNNLILKIQKINSIFNLTNTSDLITLDEYYNYSTNASSQITMTLTEYNSGQHKYSIESSVQTIEFNLTNLNHQKVWLDGELVEEDFNGTVDLELTGNNILEFSPGSLGVFPVVNLTLFNSNNIPNRAIIPEVNFNSGDYSNIDYEWYWTNGTTDLTTYTNTSLNTNEYYNLTSITPSTGGLWTFNVRGQINKSIGPWVSSSINVRYNFSGTVKEEDGTPVNANIIVIDQDTTEVFNTTQTDTSGIWNFYSYNKTFLICSYIDNYDIDPICAYNVVATT